MHEGILPGEHLFCIETREQQFYRAVCSCLWRSKWYEYPAHASAHGRKHTSGLGPYCPWEYGPPFDSPLGSSGALCNGPATTRVQYRADGRKTVYCLNHAQREVNGGQAKYTED